jgi:RNA polymerase sigma-70 factor (ECF subfamily)
MDAQEKHHLTQLSRGNKQSFAFLFEKYRSKVYFYCFQFVRSREIAQEITLDVFTRIWEKHATIESEQSISGLLLKITRDYSITYLRKAAKDLALRKEFVQNYLQSLDNPLEEHLFIKEGMQIAKQAIDGLPPRCRQVFQLRYAEGFSLKEIAEELNISISTVKKQLKKGTLIVRDYLEANTDLVFVLILGQLI